MLKNISFSGLLFAIVFLFGQQSLHAQSPLILGGYKAKASSDKSVCMKIYGREFNQILSMQYTLKWD